MTGRGRSDLRVYPSPLDVAEAVADLFAGAARDAMRERGRFCVALAGGRTPRAAYELLGAEERREAIDWRRVSVYFGDERCVPPESADSNYKMALEALLSKVSIPPRNVHRMHGEEQPARAARAYAKTLIETMGESPRFDLILLGMGEDGHTASLFPGTDPHADEDQLVRAPFVEQLGEHRLTVTPLVINNARHIGIAVESERKSATLALVLSGPLNPIKYPVQAVAPVDGKLEWFADRAAAEKLPP